MATSTKAQIDSQVPSKIVSASVERAWIRLISVRSTGNRNKVLCVVCIVARRIVGGALKKREDFAAIPSYTVGQPGKAAWKGCPARAHSAALQPAALGRTRWMRTQIETKQPVLTSQIKSFACDYRRGPAGIMQLRHLP
jgi:hypothetical protein